LFEYKKRTNMLHIHTDNKYLIEGYFVFKYEKYCCIFTKDEFLVLLILFDLLYVVPVEKNT
jgi:hypothetical protein